jgi:hypothetical protein
LNSYYFVYNRYSATVEDYVPAIQMIEQQARPGDTVLFLAYWQEGYFLSYYHGAPLTYGSLDQQPDLDRAVAQSRNVWAVVQALPYHGAEAWLAQHAFPLGENDFGQMRVLTYRAGTPGRGEKFAAPIVFSNGIELLGYHINDAPVESGRGIVTLQLDWQAAQKIAANYSIRVRLTDASGEIVWAQADSPPSNGTQPTSAWQPGQTIADHHVLTIPPGTPPGTYAIHVVVFDPKNSSAADIAAPENRRGQTLSLGSVDVVKPKGAAPALTIPWTLDAQWDGIALAGFASLPDEIAAGEALPLTLYWQARQKPTRDYRVHVRVIDSTGTLRASDSHQPANAAFPTSAWDAGETWGDKFQLKIDPNSPPGDASVFVFVTDDKSEETLALRTSAPTRDLQIDEKLAAQNRLAHAVRIAGIKIVK